MLVGSVRSVLSSVKKSVLRASSEEKNMEQLTVYSRFMLAGRRGRGRGRGTSLHAMTKFLILGILWCHTLPLSYVV